MVCYDRNLQKHKYLNNINIQSELHIGRPFTGDGNFSLVRLVVASVVVTVVVLSVVMFCPCVVMKIIFGFILQSKNMCYENGLFPAKKIDGQIGN